MTSSPPSGVRRPTLASACLNLTATALLACLFLMLKGQLDTYNDHTVGVTVRRERDFPELEFPGVSICVKYYDYGTLLNDLGIMPNPFRPITNKIVSNPSTAYQRISYRDMNVSHFLWNYYFTVEKVLKRTMTVRSRAHINCIVGGLSCDPPWDMPAWPEGQDAGRATYAVETEGGQWVSRFMADSQLGDNVLCHTLLPNASVDFSRQDGNAIAFTWLEELNHNVPHWWIYLHDRREHLVLPSYSMVDLPRITLRGVDPDTAEATYGMSYKAKARILPEYHVKPNTKYHPCEDDEDYSQYLCELKVSWARRLKTLRRKFGSRFTCLLPGVISDSPDAEMPLCTKDFAQDENDTLGYVDLISPDKQDTLMEYDELTPGLVRPPIGTERISYLHDDEDDDFDISEVCLPRCKSFVYGLKQEDASHDDSDIQRKDAYLYFSSRAAETWTEFEEYTVLSLLSDVGGSMGLLLGLSIFSLVELGLGLAKAALGKVVRLGGGGKSKRKKPTGPGGS